MQHDSIANVGSSNFQKFYTETANILNLLTTIFTGTWTAAKQFCQGMWANTKQKWNSTIGIFCFK